MEIINAILTIVIATTITDAMTPNLLESQRRLAMLSDKLLEESGLDPIDLQNIQVPQTQWVDQYIRPMLIEVFGLDDTWKNLLKTHAEYVNQQHNSEAEYCHVVEETIMPAAAVPFILENAEHLLEPKVPFPSYDIENGETGVFDLNKPMSINGTLQYVPVDQIGNIKDTGVIRIAIVGDWAAGTAESMQMAEYLKNSGEEIHYTFHLGNAHFTDRERKVESQGRCNDEDLKLKEWFRGTRGTFALNGNQEMYSRGKGYFDKLLPAYNQKTSYGMFQSEYWNLFMLDTGYNSLPEINSISSLLDMFSQYAGNPQAEMPDQVKQWLEDPHLNLVDPSATQSIFLAQHMQLIQPFVDPLGFGTSEEHTKLQFWDKAIGTNTRYMQKLLKSKGFDDGYTLTGVWGHDQKSASLITDIPASSPDEIDVTLLGQMMGQGGSASNAPEIQPRFADTFGMQWYDSAPYRNITTFRGSRSEVGYNGWNTITIDRSQMKIEYYRSIPFEEEYKFDLAGYRILESLGRDRGAREIRSWSAPSVQTNF